MQQYINVWKKYAVFKGRATRTEYWTFALFNLLIAIILIYVDKFSGMIVVENVGVLRLIYSLAILVPSLAVFVRRLHDTNHSSWWFFIGLIPIIGFIILLVFLLTDGTPGDNKYGPNPKNATRENSVPTPNIPTNPPVPPTPQ